MAQFDVIFVMPYIFSDHPSFPEGILKRHLEAHGFRVGVIQIPFWQKAGAFSILGKPRLFFAIIPGPVDSMVLNYTSTRKRRREDLYQYEGKAFFEGYPASIKYKIRPDQTVVVFANRIRQVFKDSPIVIGGIEAAMRRFVHYDFQKNKLKRSILLDSRANLLVTGRGEKQLVKMAQEINSGKSFEELSIAGTAKIIKKINSLQPYTFLPGIDEILKHPAKLMEATIKQEKAKILGQWIIQQQGDQYVLDLPAQEYTTEDLDNIYGYPYSRNHPGGQRLSPALQMNLFSVTSFRGCGGGCAFCTVSLQEGNRIISRSESSILKEIFQFQHHPQWKGIISDIGGASAELYGTDCHNYSCQRKSCLYRVICRTSYGSGRFLQLLRAARKIKGIKKVFLGSGVRYDILLETPMLLEEILRFHAGKFLRIAPEHTESNVLQLMRKPGFDKFREFVKLFTGINSKLKRKVELAPYLIVGHPGETIDDVKQMGKRLKELKIPTSDVQIFTPTPGSLSTAMYYAKISPDFNKIPVEQNIKELMLRKYHLTS